MKTNKLPSEYQDVTPLAEAVLKGDYKTIEYQLANKVDVNEANAYGITALMAAAFINDRKAVRILIRAKAAPLLYNNNGKTALDIADSFSYAKVREAMLSEISKLRQKEENYRNTLRKDNAKLYFSTTQSTHSVENRTNSFYKKTKDIKSSTPSLLLSSIVTSVVATTTEAIKYALENTSDLSESRDMNQRESSVLSLDAHFSEKFWGMAGAVTLSIVASGIIGTAVYLMRRPDDCTKNQDKSILLPDLIDVNKIGIISSQSDERAKNQEDSPLFRNHRVKNRRDSVPRMSEIDSDTIELEKISREMDELLNKSRLPEPGTGSAQNLSNSVVEESMHALHTMDRCIDKLQETLACCRVLSATVDDSSAVNKLIDDQTTMTIISKTHKAFI